MTLYPPKHLVVPVDFSAPSLAGLEAAKAIGVRHGAVLELVLVQEVPPDLALTYGAAAMIERQWRDYRRWAEKELRRLAGDYPAARLKVRCQQGYVSVVLGRLSQRPGPAMVVMGTHGYTGVRRLLFGSLAETLLHSAQIPVLTVHQRRRPLRFGRILAPVNFTDYADRSLAYALSIARGEGGRVSALYVAPEDESGDPRRLLRGHLERAWGERAAWIHPVVRQGNPEREILEEAVEGKFDLIVMAARRKPFWKEFVLGMTAERVLRHSPVPVLSIPSVGAAKGKAAARREGREEPIAL